ncbi:MAG: hypothetical protein J5I93_25640 [Pirellulaceae bacterium]|nr:hypothetical protein [Pirellulaceae bacterium]
MKAVFVCNLHYFRRVDASIATVLELGDLLSCGDVLADVVTGQEFVVSERGFPPTRSPETSCRLRWSREVSATFEGRCRACEGRLLFAGDVSGLRCIVVKGQIKEKNEPLPIETPIIGAVRFEAYDCPAILKINEALQAELVVLARIETVIECGSLEYICVSPDRTTIEVNLIVAAVDGAARVGRILEWHEADAPVVMS